MKKDAFNIYHPGIAALFFVAVLVFSMAIIQPVYIALNFVAGFSYSIYLRGLRQSIRSLSWQVPLIALIALVNPIFSSAGSTELFRIGTHAIFLESYIYGACFGLLLITVLIWFLNAAQILTSEKTSALLGGKLPTLSLIISMMLRLVPRLVEQGKEIQMVQNINRPDIKYTKRQGISAYARNVSVLMGWSTENSLETADTMRARGWGAVNRRTTYAHYSIKARDIVAFSTLLLLIVFNIFLASIALAQFQFYPFMSKLVLWWGYLIYAILVFLPLLIQGVEGLRWRL